VNPTASREPAPRRCLILVAHPPAGQGIRRGRVWDFDTGVLAEPAPVVPSRLGRCAHCGAGAGRWMLRVLHEGRAFAFCDNGECVISVSAVVAFEPHGAFEGLDGVEHMGIYTCACGRVHIVGGPAGNWTLAYCPEPCGRGVLTRPALVEQPARRAS
jgi:hypothetical protein